jgi:hypothetical protein
MDFFKQFPFSSVYKMTDYGLSLYTQEYVVKYLDEAEKEKLKSKEEIEAEEERKKFPKKSEINTEPELEIPLSVNNYS